MAVGASFADLAVILIDATKGVLVQIRRHARICAFMGIRYFVLAVNKMDLADYAREPFERICAQIDELKKELGLQSVKIIPLSAAEGENVTRKSEHMPWYEGEPLLEYLENIKIDAVSHEEGFYLPVQRVCRPDHTFRGFQGQIEAGRLHEGDELTALPSGTRAAVKAIYVGERLVASAVQGQPVTVELDREIDVTRGSVLVRGATLHTASRFEATLLWMDDDPLINTRSMFIKGGHASYSGENHGHPLYRRCEHREAPERPKPAEK